MMLLLLLRFTRVYYTTYENMMKPGAKPHTTPWIYPKDSEALGRSSAGERGASPRALGK